MHGFSSSLPGALESAGDGREAYEPFGERGLLGGEKKRNEILQMAMLERSSRFWMRRIRAGY